MMGMLVQSLVMLALMCATIGRAPGRQDNLCIHLSLFCGEKKSVALRAEASAPSWSVHDHPASPCIKVCKLDRDGVCMGCFRSIEEISAWAMLSADQKRGVLENSRLRERREA